MAVDALRWQSRRVLVTGADGFIGSHLTEALLERGARVRAICQYNSQGDWGWLRSRQSQPSDNLEVWLGDIRDPGWVDQACAGMEIIFHLAALIAIPYSYAAPQSFLETNVGGTLNILEAARHHAPQRVVHTSTSEVYGTPASLPIRETHPLQAQSPYAASKIAADQMAAAYYCAFDLPVITLRPFNTYGPRQSARAVLPSVLLQLLAGQREVALGRLDPRRDLTYVSDTVEGFLQAGLAPGVEGNTVHLGTGHAVSVAELFAIACEVLKVQATVREEATRLRPRKSEVLALLSDPTQAAQRLGWQARVSLEEGVARTAAWLREHRSLYGDRSFQL
jgi:UDP-glucose 4-epimerase